MGGGGREGSDKGWSIGVVDWLGSNLHIDNFVHILRAPCKANGKRPDFLKFLQGLQLPFAGIVSPRDDRFSKASEKLQGPVGDTKEEPLIGIQTRPNAWKGSELVVGQGGPAYNTDVLLQLSTQVHSGGAVSKEDLGRATWIFLHTLAAQFPDKPTKHQQRDVKELMAILTRLYPCKQCADHLKDVLKSHPVKAGSGFELAQWMCQVHNVVNRSLGKPQFPCQHVDARWGALDCNEGVCDLEGRLYHK